MNKPKLTYCQKRVADLIAKGLSTVEIAAELGRSRKTIEIHTTLIVAKLAPHLDGKPNRARLALYLATNENTSA